MTRKKKKTVGQKYGAFDYINITLFVIFSAIMIYPFWYVVIIAFTESRAAIAGPMYFWPRQFTIINFQFVLQNRAIGQAFLVTIARTALFPIVQVITCMLCAYGLSKRDLPMRKEITLFLMLPMFIGGSMMTNYLLMVKIGLMNKFLVYILPGAFSFFTMIIMRSFIEGIPPEIEESVKIDGAGYPRIFFQIVVPLTKPIISTFLFFGAVYAWKDFGTNLLYVTKKDLYVIQYLLYRVLQDVKEASIEAQMAADQYTTYTATNTPLPQAIKTTMLVIVTFPLIFVYPFFQKYFVKGMYIGAVKA